MRSTLRVAMRAVATAMASFGAIAAAAQSPSATTTSNAAAWRSECGSCHVAFPPRFLQAADWRAVMSRLDRHYGDDASVDAATADAIGRHLESLAGRRAGGNDGGLPRITTGRWFAKEHRDVARSTWSTPDVRSRANCAACHRNAAQGDFDDDDVRIPR
jgi:hypothetical protein